MRLSAVICEYNPLHFGHSHHLHVTRAQTACDAIVCVMSGSFVQRGECAVMDKYTRARHAILSGADLVVELPPIFALSSAQYFAKGAIDVVSQIDGVDCLSFGSESGDLSILNNYIDTTQSADFDKAVQAQLSYGLSYPKACELAYSSLSDLPNPALSPNNLLGIEYIKALRTASRDIRPFTITRNGANYNDLNIVSQQFASSSAIRSILRQITAHTTVDGSIVPPHVLCDINDIEHYHDITSIQDRIFSIVCDKLYNTTQGDLDNLYEGGEGLGNRLKKMASSATDYASLISLTHTKRYTKNKIARLVMHLLLGHTSQMSQLLPPVIPIAVKSDQRHLLSYLPTNSLNNIDNNIEYADYLYSVLNHAPRPTRHIEFV